MGGRSTLEHRARLGEAKVSVEPVAKPPEESGAPFRRWSRSADMSSPKPSAAARRRRPSPVLRWLGSFVQWGAVLLVALVASSYAAWGLGHFLWVARGREHSWRERQLEIMMGRFVMMGAPTRNAPPEGAWTGTSMEVRQANGTVRVSGGSVPPGLAYARVTTGIPEDTFAEFAAGGNTQWSINEPAPAGWMIHMAEVQQMRMLADPDDRVHPWSMAGPGAVYRKDAGGKVTHCTMQFEAPWEPRTQMPLERLIAVWGEPAAIAWSAGRTGRLAAAWLLHDGTGKERQMVLVDWRCTPPSFGRRCRTSLRIHMFDSGDALWSSRRPTGGLMPTDTLAEQMRAQLSAPALSLAKRLAAFEDETKQLSDGRFSELFGFERSEIADFVAAGMRRPPAFLPRRTVTNPRQTPSMPFVQPEEARPPARGQQPEPVR